MCNEFLSEQNKTGVQRGTHDRRAQSHACGYSGRSDIACADEIGQSRGRGHRQRKGNHVEQRNEAGKSRLRGQRVCSEVRGQQREDLVRQRLSQKRDCAWNSQQRQVVPVRQRVPGKPVPALVSVDEHHVEHQEDEHEPEVDDGRDGRANVAKAEVVDQQPVDQNVDWRRDEEDQNAGLEDLLSLEEPFPVLEENIRRASQDQNPQKLLREPHHLCVVDEFAEHRAAVPPEKSGRNVQNERKQAAALCVDADLCVLAGSVRLRTQRIERRRYSLVNRQHDRARHGSHAHCCQFLLPQMPDEYHRHKREYLL
ncbi:hypothetical protein KL930_001083 [Ogataea haglerorum]|uniref:Uncharacterized protein n=1 Tax=Ogataea haglerorum TaxID=1937702 RepID=A0ABQ7RN45_9ASCO|nr:hypothetical protein KL915_001084 [Ogataea haglerorum]KAG7711868.1 hypothetical protein KL914_000510 [Ogataea haglerorum]KAG7745226.1 hypothetical protein KL932_000256 [Ogataea haglerorum]KAG7768971.1 hypothetical protein KL946_000254 [Ogataea haglerorum]KAG7781113.1 hypothetical protein KL922_000035 [Ogataea haglerorum]